MKFSFSMSHKKAVGWPGAGEALAVRMVICSVIKPILSWVEVGEGAQLLLQFQPRPLNNPELPGACIAGALESEALNFLEHCACLCTCNSHLLNCL